MGGARGTGREVEQLEPDGFAPRRDQDGEGRVWAAYMHTTTVTAVGNKVVSGLTLYCTGGDKLTFGTTASADLGSSCGVQGSYMMRGFNTFSGIYVDSLGPRCDPMFDITQADWYGLQRGGTGVTSGSLLCDEGEYMAGAKVYRVNTANGYVFNGISLMCREPQERSPPPTCRGRSRLAAEPLEVEVEVRDDRDRFELELIARRRGRELRRGNSRPAMPPVLNAQGAWERRRRMGDALPHRDQGYRRLGLHR